MWPAVRSGRCKPWGSFECWSAMIPPAIVFAGGADPMLTRPTVSGEQDVEKLGLLAILDGLACMDPKSAGVSAKVILASCSRSSTARRHPPPTTASRGCARPSSR